MPDELVDDEFLLEDEQRSMPADAPRAAPKTVARRPARQRSEAKIQRGCQDVILAQYGGYVIKHWGGSHSVAGTPDLLACLDGRMVVVEVKRPGERPTVVQMSQMRRWQDAGAVAVWVTDEEQLRLALNRSQGDPSWRADLDIPGGGA